MQQLISYTLWLTGRARGEWQPLTLTMWRLLLQSMLAAGGVSGYFKRIAQQLKRAITKIPFYLIAFQLSLTGTWTNSNADRIYLNWFLKWLHYLHFSKACIPRFKPIVKGYQKWDTGVSQKEDTYPGCLYRVQLVIWSETPLGCGLTFALLGNKDWELVKIE